ncbi:MAG: hypothetical protein IKO99_02395 [Bacteroidales bacterium]|nr:hypothetical protein [Bacteroidales bacterium]
MKRLLLLIFVMMFSLSIMAQGKKDYVNLGLSSGTLWAACNVGAESPEQSGGYFGWGETVPHFYNGKWSQPLKEGCYGYCWANYKYCNLSFKQLTKYCCQEEYGEGGFTDYRVLLSCEDDAAYVIMGRKWQIPTEEQWQELLDECQWTWTDNYNNTSVAGYIVANRYKKDAYIFLPAAGFYDKNFFYQGNLTGDYWSSSLDKNNSSYARFVSFNSGGCRVVSNNRFYGISIRAVRKKIVGNK